MVPAGVVYLWQMNALFSYILSYGGMATVGLLAAAGCAVAVGLHEKLDWPVLFPILSLSLLPLYLGAKLFGVLSLLSYRLELGLPVSLHELLEDSGIVFYGGMLFFLLSVKLSIRRFVLFKQASSWGLAALIVPLFHGFARIGCYFGRCCYGIELEGPFFARFFEHRLPVQLLESGFNFLLFIALLLLFFYRRKSRGKLVRVYLLSYGLFRFIIEFFRGDALRGGFGPLSFSQWVSLCVLLGLALRWALVWHRKRRQAS